MLMTISYYYLKYDRVNQFSTNHEFGPDKLTITCAYVFFLLRNYYMCSSTQIQHFDTIDFTNSHFELCI